MIKFECCGIVCGLFAVTTIVLRQESRFIVIAAPRNERFKHTFHLFTINARRRMAIWRRVNREPCKLCVKDLNYKLKRYPELLVK